MNDQLLPSQVVAASGTLALILAAGMTLGPTLGGVAIGHFGAGGIFYLLSILSLLIVTTAVFRLWRTPSVADQRGTAIAVSINLTPEATTLFAEASGDVEQRAKH